MMRRHESAPKRQTAQKRHDDRGDNRATRSLRYERRERLNQVRNNELRQYA